MYTHRVDYMNYLTQLIWKKQIIKVLLGQRRSGKSTLLIMLMKHLIEQGTQTNEILFINKENSYRSYIKNNEDILQLITHQKFIFIDEIQDIENWQLAIRHLQHTGEYDIFISWSNSKLLWWELATHLAGRYITQTIRPFSYQEYCLSTWQDLWKDSFEAYMVIWWLPWIVWLWSLPDIQKNYLHDIISSIVYKDIIDRFQIRNTKLFEQLLQYTAIHIWDILSAHSISKYLKSQKSTVTANTIIEYLSYCKQAYIIQEVTRYDIKSKQIFEFKNKYYFTDIGIRNELVWWYHRSDVDGILENIVYNEMSRRWRECMIWEIGDKEIDFVCTKDSKTIYIQVCYKMEGKKTMEREFWNLLSIKDSHPKYIVWYEWNEMSKDGIQVVPVWDFITMII